MNALSIVLLVITGICLLPAVYLAVLAAAALIPRRSTSRDGTPSAGRIAFVIPAHNEETLIATTLRKIRESRHPADLIEVFVIADNCSDRTAAIAREFGAVVGERKGFEEGRGKPFALRWFLARYGERLEGFDAVALIDADTEIDPDFPAAILRALTDPEVDVVQGYHGTSNVDASWRAAITEVALTVSHHVRPLGRNRIGSTCGLKGNGMAFRPGVLLENGWPAKALIEDLEITILLMERGIRVRYAPDARVYAEMASGREGATTQRLRWEGGRVELIRNYSGRLFRLLFTRHRWQALESAFDLITPPFVAYFGGLCLLFLLNLFAGHPAATGAAAGAVLLLLAMTVQGLITRRSPRRCWMALLELPRFALWKLDVYRKLLDPRTQISWTRTTRNHEIANTQG